MKKKDYAIILKNVSKKFKLIHETSSLFLLKKRKEEDLFVLENINLKIKKGQCVGIIGPNGAGKTTLLKIIASILRPTKGIVNVNGKLLTFLEMGSGFKEELTGKENIYLYGSLLGMKKSEIRKKFNKILEFAHLEKFVNVKLKDYSNGMRLRLAFGIAMVNEPEIVLIDEIIAVGDTEFQKKSLNRIKLLKDLGKTVIIVSHDLPLIRMLCDEAIFLNQGKIQSYGVPQKVIMNYLDYSGKYEIQNKYDLLLKKHSSYNSLVKKIKSLVKEKEKNQDFLSKLFSKKIDIDLEKMKTIELQLKLDLLDIVNDILDNPHLFRYTFWEEYNSKTLSSEKKLAYLKKIKLIKKATKIKQKIASYHHTLYNLLFLQELFDIELLLVNTETERNEIIKENVEKYQEYLRSNLDLSEKISVIGKFKEFVNGLNMELITVKSLDLIFRKYRESLLKYKIIPEDEINDNIKLITRNYMLDLEEHITHLKLKIQEDNGIKGNKKENKRLERLNDLKKRLSNIFVSCYVNKKKHYKKKLKNDTKIVITNVKFINNKEKEDNVFFTGDQLKIQISYETNKKIIKPVFGIGIYGDDGTHITGPNTKFHNVEIPYIEDVGSITYIIDKLPLLEGRYLVTATLHPYNSFEPYDIHDKKYSFEIKNKNIKDIGIIHINSRWEHKK